MSEIEGNNEMENKVTKFDIDIEIKDLLWEFLRKWRLIVIMTLICGIGLVVYQYRSDLNSSTVTTVKKSQKDLEASMSTQDIDEVIGAAALKRQLDQKSVYMDASELMQINPYEENAVLLQYYVNAENEQIEKEATEAYKDFVENGYLAKKLVETGEFSLKEMYLGELVSVVDVTGLIYSNADNSTENLVHVTLGEDTESSFNVKVCGRDMESAKHLAQVVQTVLNQYSVNVIDRIGSNELQLLQEAECVLVDETLAEIQNWNATAIKTISNNIDKMKNEMTGDQITLYTYRTVLDSVTDTQTIVTVREVSISVKHGVIGAVIGVVLACIIIFVLYLFESSLRTVEEAKKLYKVKLLGTVDDTAFQKKRVFEFVDSFVRKLQANYKKRFTYNQELQMIGANIAIDCKKNNRTKIFLTSSLGEDIPTQIKTDIIKICTEKGIEVVEGNEIAYDAESLEALALVGSVVFIEKKRESLYDELYKEMVLCIENDISVVGMIVLGA